MSVESLGICCIWIVVMMLFVEIVRKILMSIVWLVVLGRLGSRFAWSVRGIEKSMLVSALRRWVLVDRMIGFVRFVI